MAVMRTMLFVSLVFSPQLRAYGVAAASLIVASWPRSGRSIHILSVPLFVLGVVIKLAVRRSLLGVFG
jgi:hypothetical protein